MKKSSNYANLKMKEMSRGDLVDARIDFNITKEVTS